MGDTRVRVCLSDRPFADPDLRSDEAEVWVMLQVRNAARHEVDLALIRERDEQRPVDRLAIDARPEVGCGTRCRRLEAARAARRAVEPGVAEPAVIAGAA